MFSNSATTGSPTPTGAPVVTEQPRSSCSLFPVRCVGNSNECLTTSCAVVTAACMGGVFGTAASCTGASASASLCFGMGGALGSFLGVFAGAASAVGLSAVICPDTPTTTHSPTVNTVSGGLDNVGFEGDEPK